jgi:hypothetical protein
LPAPLTRAIVGHLPYNLTGGPTTLALSAANTQLALGFVIPAQKTLAEVAAFLSAVNGTLGAGSLSCDLRNDLGGLSAAGGQPAAASVESRSTVASVPAGAGRVDFTGWTSVIPPDTQQWCVFRNTDGAPATNFPTYRWGGTVTHLPIVHGGPAVVVPLYGWGKLHATDGATFTTSPQPASAFLRLKFTDGTFAGFPFNNILNPGSAVGVYGTREAGARVTIPADWPVLRVAGITLYLRRNNTPTNNLLYKLYAGGGASPTLLATTAQILPTSQVATTPSWYHLFFASPQLVFPGQTYRLTCVNDAGGDSTTSYFSFLEQLIDNDANSKALVPFSSQRTYFDGAAWADTDTATPAWGFILDFSQEYVPGLVIVPRRKAYSLPAHTPRRRQVLVSSVQAAAPQTIVALRRRGGRGAADVFRARKFRPVVMNQPAPAPQVVIPRPRRKITTAPAVVRRNRPVVNVVIQNAAGPVVISYTRKVR